MRKEDLKEQFLEFDGAQKQAIAVQRNAVIMAGAGSGKTSVLAERFYWLLATREVRVDQILTLTFTQKAAAEMYERIYNRLKQAAAPGIRRQLQDFDQAQISTLDSFCAQIVRNAGEQFGLPPDFGYDQERLAARLKGLSLDFMLSRLEHPALGELLLIHGFEVLWNDFFTPLALRYFHLGRRIDLARDAARQIERCRLDLQDYAGAFQEARLELLDLPPRLDSIRRNQELLGRLGDPQILIREERHRELAERLEELKLKKPGGRAGEEVVRLKALVDRLHESAVPLAILAHTLDRAAILHQAAQLLQEFESLVAAEKRGSGLLTFQDVMELAIQALLENKELRRYYKERFRYIMIDEFQDNNQLQKELLYLLAEGRDRCGEVIPRADQLEPDKLFFVGDEKQSIYRFRGADVSVFKHLREELLQEGGTALELARNYRSQPGLIHFFNRLFPRIMGSGELDFEARFQELEPQGEENAVTPEVIFLYKPYHKQNKEETPFSNEQSEAYTVARFLHQLVSKRRLQIPDQGGKRPAEFSDIALLMRSTSNQIVYEQMFRHFGIPYTTQNVRSLFLEAPINDFYNLLQLVVYPQDRTAYAALLRSPLVNISDQTLLWLLLGDKERLQAGERVEPFTGIEALKARGPAAEDAPAGVGQGAAQGTARDAPQGAARETMRDVEKLEQGRALYRRMRQLADQRPISELVFHWWYRAGYRYYILQNPRYHNYLEYYDYLLELAERADRGGTGLARFLDFLRQNLGLYEKQEELEILKPRVAGVQLMTIHKAKGLEFPIVFLPDTGNRGRSGGSAPYYLSPRFGLTLNLGVRNYFQLLDAEEEEKREIAELKRLLYVALTRAQFHLILSGGHNRQNQNSSRAHLNMLLPSLDSLSGSDNPEDEPPPGNGRAYRFRSEQFGDLREEEFRRTGPRQKKLELATIIPRYRQAGVIRRQYARREVSVTELSESISHRLGDRLDQGLKSGRPPAGRPATGGPATGGTGAPERGGRRLPSLPVDPLLQEEELENQFGTLTHALIAHGLSNGPQADFVPDWSGYTVPQQHRRLLLEQAWDLGRRFFSSTLGRSAAAADRLEVEYPFLYRWDGEDEPLYLSGQIDLFFENPQGAFIVDFKTDRFYRPGEHRVQLGLYSLAAGELTAGKVSACLFLLRSGEAIPLGGDVDWRRALRLWRAVGASGR